MVSITLDKSNLQRLTLFLYLWQGRFSKRFREFYLTLYYMSIVLSIENEKIYTEYFRLDIWPIMEEL